jgi:hypothetical protein
VKQIPVVSDENHCQAFELGGRYVAVVGVRVGTRREFKRRAARWQRERADAAAHPIGCAFV